MRKYYKFEMNLTIGNILSIVFFLLALIPLVFTKLEFEFEIKSFVIIFVLYIFWMFLHELLHGLGHIVCGVKPKDISFGATLEKGVLFCLIRREVNKKGILVSLLFPFFFIGIVTYIIGIIIHSPALMILSIFNISGASIDLLMVFTFSRLGNDITYIEPGDGTSFYLMSNKEIKKLWGFKLIEEGNYSSDMFKGNKYKKMDISKVSAIILGVLLITSLIIIFI